MIQGRMNTP